jgi:hypothetical protein
MAALMPLGKRRKGAAAGDEDGDDEHTVSLPLLWPNTNRCCCRFFQISPPAQFL